METPTGSEPLQRTYKRIYKACESCRTTKSKCERDASDICLKCRREQRECIFPTQRSVKRVKLGQLQDAEDRSRETWRFRPGGVKDAARQTDIRTHGGLPVTSNSQHVDNPNTVLRPEGLDYSTVDGVVVNPSDAVGLLLREAGHGDAEGATTLEDPVSHHVDAYAETPSGRTPMLLMRDPVPQQILELWSQHRFIRQGWFTEREAVGYIQAFFAHLSILSPVLESFNDDYASHRRLVVEEPLLCCTILMISSRRYQPPGLGGAMRTDFIHSRLWKHIEHLLQRITLGAEKYSVAKSRTLGSIEALLLITDWHPRAIHFPPENDGWDASLAPSVDDSFTPRSTDNEAARRWREDVFEPAKRSDRLSWMLLGMAMTLAHELGVFKTDADSLSGARQRSVDRIRKLLYLYSTQLSLRLGCTNIFPQEILLDVLQASSASELRGDGERLLLLSQWLEITKLLSTAAEMFFGSPAATKKLLRSTRYLTLLEHFKPLLDKWYHDYRLHFVHATPHSKILLVDYYYARMYIHSIAMQALVEQASNRVSSELHTLAFTESRSTRRSQDAMSVEEVRVCSCKILALAVDFAEQGLLQHCPVRLYLRVVCASVFLLKALSLGAHETDTTTALKTLENTIEVLHAKRADDIHLSGRYSVLMARHVQKFKQNMQLQKADVRASSGAQTRNVSPTGAAESTVLFRDSILNQGQSIPLDASDPNAFDLADADIEYWMTQPFDPQMAPFSLDYTEPGVGLAQDSLDFLWNV